MAHFLFFLLAVVCVASVFGMIISKNQAYSALFVILTFTCTAGLFALLDAPFIAVIQLIIYAGAIMVLFIFVIMMVDFRKGISPEKKKWTLGFASVIAVILLIELIVALKMAFIPLNTSSSQAIGNTVRVRNARKPNGVVPTSHSRPGSRSLPSPAASARSTKCLAKK